MGLLAITGEGGFSWGGGVLGGTGGGGVTLIGCLAVHAQNSLGDPSRGIHCSAGRCWEAKQHLTQALGP